MTEPANGCIFDVNGPIGYVTDLEGNVDLWERFIESLGTELGAFLYRLNTRRHQQIGMKKSTINLCRIIKWFVALHGF